MPTNEIPFPDSTPQLQYCIDALQQSSSQCTLNSYVNLDEEEGDYPRVSLHKEHWNMEEILDRHLCIHEHSILHELCPYPYPFGLHILIIL